MSTESPQQAILLFSSLVAGCLQVAVSLLPRPEGLAHLPSLLAVVSLTVLTLWVVQEALWASSGWLLGRRRNRRPPGRPLALAIAAFTLTAASLWPAFGFLRLTLKAQAVVFPTFLATAILAPLLAHLAGERWGRIPAVRTAGRVLALATPAIAFEGLLLLWLLHVHRDGRGVTPALGLFIAAATVTAATAVWASRRFRLVPALAILALILLASPAASLLAVDAAGHPVAQAPALAPAGRPPYILLLTIDTLRADAVDGAGSESWAPAIQALARDSVTFAQARSAAPWTKPGIASLLTGLSPLVHRTTRLDSRLPDDVRTLAEHLREAGYATAAIGRNTTLDRRYHYDQGFDAYHFSEGNALGDSLGGSLLTALRPARYRADWSSRDLTTRAVSWIRAHRHRPFFLWLHYLDPHVPYAPPRELLPGPAPGTMGHTFDDLYGVRTGRLFSAAERQWVGELYHAEVRDVDANVGRLVQALKELDLYEPCLLVLASDHGEELWEHGGFEHGHSLYDELLRVPLSFKLPHRRFTGRIEASVSTESVTPTILDILGTGSRETAFTAPSLRSWWYGPPAADREGQPVVSAGTLYYDDRISLVFDGKKYVRSRITGREELYDLRADPGETTSLLPGASEALQQARRLLADRGERYQALSQALRISPESLGDEQRELRERLRSLGYVQ